MLSAAGCELWAVGCELSASGCELWASGCELWVADCELLAAGCVPMAAGCEPMAACYVVTSAGRATADEQQGADCGLPSAAAPAFETADCATAGY